MGDAEEDISHEPDTTGSDVSVEDAGGEDADEEDAGMDLQYDEGEPDSGPERCPEGDCEDSCLPEAFSTSVTDLGIANILKFFEDRLVLVKSESNSAWAPYSYIDYMTIEVDRGLISDIRIADAHAKAAVWTGSAFGIFGTTGRFILVDPSGEILRDTELSRSYSTVVWTGDAFAALWRDLQDDYYAWNLTRIDVDGAEVDTAREVTREHNVLDFEWSGTSFILALPKGPGTVARRFFYSIIVFDWDGIPLDSPIIIDESGLVKSGKLFKTSPGVAALWLESSEDDEPIAVFARFLDNIGQPCGPPVLIDEVIGIPVYDGYELIPTVRYEGAWSDCSGIIAYTRVVEPEHQLVLRSLFADGRVGHDVVALTGDDFFDDYYFDYAFDFYLTAEGGNIAFSHSYLCGFDMPPCLDVYLDDCNAGE